MTKRTNKEWKPAAWQLDPEMIETEKVQYWSKNGTMLTAQMTKEEAKEAVRSGRAFVITGQAINQL